MEKKEGKRREDSFQQKIFSLIKEIKGHKNMITIPTAILKYCGDIETACLLSQLIYWCDKGKAKNGYIFKSCNEWFEETGLSEYLIKTRSEKLKEQGLLITAKLMSYLRHKERPLFLKKELSRFCFFWRERIL